MRGGRREVTGEGEEKGKKNFKKRRNKKLIPGFFFLISLSLNISTNTFPAPIPNDTIITAIAITNLVNEYIPSKSEPTIYNSE